MSLPKHPTDPPAPPNPPDSPAGAPKQASLITYPCDFPIKVMGLRTDDFAQTITDLVMQQIPAYDPSTLEMRPSKSGNYLGLTLIVPVDNREQLDDLYRLLTQHPQVKVVL